MAAGGALRYRCPTTAGFVLLTDDHTLSAPPLTVRCHSCGAMHRLQIDGEGEAAA